MFDKLTEDDLAWIQRSGRRPQAVLQQLRTLRTGPAWAPVLRPCTVGDGIERLDPATWDALEARWRAAALQGRISSFVPASGAATRLLSALGGELPAALDTLFEGRVHDPARTPKGLLPFHRYADHVRTAFDEHLVEAAAMAADGPVVAHFTVSSEHQAAFEARLAEQQDALLSGVAAHVRFSTQHASTDTPCVDGDGFTVRDASGAVLFRPGGHGALLQNLASAGGDVVLVKNIDNVVRDQDRGEVLAWRRRLVGRLLQEEARARAEGDRRPVRVAGMVPNAGQPGGGPFWVDGPAGATAQIVESAQIAPEQRSMMSEGTHFNPVELVLSVRDASGDPYRLGDFTDPKAVIITRKKVNGVDATVLEHPGLWNGAMAGWRTVFVEVPAVVFRPVKTLDDLLARAQA